MAVLDFDSNALANESGSGILYVATDYDGTVYDDGDGTNESTSITDIETYTFADLWYFENFAPYVKKGDERIIMTDYTDILEISRKLEKITWFVFDMQEVLEMTNLAQVLGTSLETVSAWAGQKGTETIWMKRKMASQNYQLFKFVSTPDADWLSNIFYFVKAVLNSDINLPYINLSKDDFAWVTFDFEVAKSGNMFIKKETDPATS